MEKLLSDKIREIKDALGLTQQQLAETLGVKLDRVKSLTSGKVDKLSQAEAKALVEKLHVHSTWLATGEGEMFQSPGEAKFTTSLVTLKQVSDAVTALGLPSERAAQARDITFAVLQGSADLVNNVFDRMPTFDVDALDKAVEYVENRLTLARKKFTPQQKAQAIRLAYVLTVAERQGSATKNDMESLFELLK